MVDDVTSKMRRLSSEIHGGENSSINIKTNDDIVVRIINKTTHQEDFYIHKIYRGETISSYKHNNNVFDRR